MVLTCESDKEIPQKLIPKNKKLYEVKTFKDANGKLQFEEKESPRYELKSQETIIDLGKVEKENLAEKILNEKTAQFEKKIKSYLQTHSEIDVNEKDFLPLKNLILKNCDKCGGFEIAEIPKFSMTLKAHAAGNIEVLNKEKTKNRIDIKDAKTNIIEIEDILSYKKMPMAKWPGKFSPALMQQIAINYVCSNDYPLFSVNGSPGTGKTTLLKEIIAQKIYEAALAISQFENSKDAFSGNEITTQNIEAPILKKWYKPKESESNRRISFLKKLKKQLLEKILQKMILQS